MMRALQSACAPSATLRTGLYSWADTTVTTNGTTLPTFDNTWQGVSKNCLSCHDGTVAIGDIAWFDATPNQNLFADQHNDPADPRLITFAVPGTGDMSGNHPVAHPFPYQGAASTYNSVSSGTEVVASGWVADPTAGGIRLFNDDGSGNVSAGRPAQRNPGPGRVLPARNADRKRLELHLLEVPRQVGEQPAEIAIRRDSGFEMGSASKETFRRAVIRSSSVVNSAGSTRTSVAGASQDGYRWRCHGEVEVPSNSNRLQSHFRS